MKIETKYNIGERVWTLEKGKNEVLIASSVINQIEIDKDKNIFYFFNEWCAEYNEVDVVAYDDTEILLEKIKELDEMIKNKEE